MPLKVMFVLPAVLLIWTEIGCAVPPLAPDVPPDVGKDFAAQAFDEGKADWSFDVCERRGWYGDGECDWFCPHHDSDCDVPVLGAEPDGEPARYPIVLEHGFAASTTNVWSFNGVAAALRRDGHTVYESEVPPFDSPRVRAERLAAMVDRALAESGMDRVNIVAHSMGGLDARELVSVRGYGDRVASVTTISSPHRGTRIADLALSCLHTDYTNPILSKLAAAFGGTFSNASETADVRATLVALSEANAPAFEAAHPDDPRVYYQSWAGVSSPFGVANPNDAVACQGRQMRNAGTTDKVDPLLLATWLVVGGGTRMIPNDGLATVESAKHGDFRGCVPMDHLDEVGQPGHQGPVTNTGFDHIRFYRNIAFELAAMGY